MNIRASLAHYQRKKSISNTTLCKECGINITVYSAFMNNKRNLPYEQLQKILDYMKLHISD